MASLFDLLQQYVAPLNQQSTTVQGVDVTAPGPATAQGIAPVHPVAAQSSPVMVPPNTGDQQLINSVPQVTQPIPDPGVSQTSSGPSVNYNNSQSADAVRQAIQGEGPASGATGNPGLYGLLPQGMQHGTLRNVLGALGDAFLVGAGKHAQYEPRMQNQQIGQAMAGIDYNNPDSVAAATQRIAMTGAPGSIETADAIQKNANDIALKNQMQKQQFMYQQERVDSSRAGRLNSIVPSIGGVLSGVTTPQTYGPAYDQIARRIASIDPSKTPEDLGLPARDAWTPGSTAGYGMTSNNEQVSSDKAAQRGVSVQDTNTRARATIQAANIGAGSKIQGAEISNERPSEANFNQQYITRKQAGLPTSPQEDAEFAHNTQISGRSRIAPPTSAKQAAPPGVPTVKAVQWLKANDSPQSRAIFAQHFPNYANNIDGILKAN